MYKISQVLENVAKYGNCVVYKSHHNNKRANQFYEFIVNSEGDLVFRNGLAIFDQEFFDGKIKNKDARVVQTILADKDNVISLATAINNLFSYSLYDSYKGEYICITADKMRKYPKSNKATCILYKTICKEFGISDDFSSLDEIVSSMDQAVAKLDCKLLKKEIQKQK